MKAFTCAGLAPISASVSCTSQESTIPSLRLANIRAGIEDWELIARLGHTQELISNAADLITQTVVNATSHKEDPILLERLRRSVARRVITDRNHKGIQLKMDDEVGTRNGTAGTNGTATLPTLRTLGLHVIHGPTRHPDLYIEAGRNAQVSGTRRPISIASPKRTLI